jgi:hypothetical protein
MITTLDDYNIKGNQLYPSATLLPPTRTTQVYFDGLCQPCNPGRIACYAFIIKNEENTIYIEYGLAV